jgi:hypothetical protein
MPYITLYPLLTLYSALCTLYFRFHCDCELSTVNFVCEAGTSHVPTVALAQMAGGGTFPRSRRQRRHLAAPTRLPAGKLGAHVIKERQLPAFPPT